MRCLRDRTLFDLSEGGGTEAARAHLRACPRCAARHREMIDAQELAAMVLRTAPLAERRAQTHVAPVWPTALWVAGAVAAMVVLALHDFYPAVHETEQREPVALAITDVSRALSGFTAGDWRPAPDSDVAFLQAALRGEWPCEQEQPSMDPRCY